MKKFPFFCGLFLILAAFPVFAQNNTAERVEINRKPLLDLTDLVIDRLQKNELVLSDNFLIEIDGELTKVGKFDRQKTRYVRVEGSEQITDIAKSAIESVNDSGYFTYLTQIESNKINLILAQDNEQIYAIIKSAFETPNRAKTFASTIALAVNLVRQTSKNEDDKVLLNGTIVSESENTVIIKIALEKEVGQEMIRRRLSDEINKKLPEKADK